MKEMEKLIDMIQNLDLSLDTISELLLQVGRAIRRELNEK